MINTTEAVRLAAEALARGENGGADCDPTEWNVVDATAAVTAALPALAEQFAAEIEAQAEAARTSPDGRHPEVSAMTHAGAMRYAARLVREAAEGDALCRCRHRVSAHRAGHWGACDYECGCQCIEVTG